MPETCKRSVYRMRCTYASCQAAADYDSSPDAYEAADEHITQMVEGDYMPNFYHEVEITEVIVVKHKQD